ncbi:cnd3 [Nucleospora cyclopteri]
MSNLNELSRLFNRVQSAPSSETANLLDRIIKIIEIDDSFLLIINKILLCKKSTIPAKLINFLNKVVEYLSDKRENILQSLFLYILQFTDSKSVLARRNSLQLLYLIIDINYEKNIEQGTLEKIAERLFDKETSVRKYAIKISMRFQDRKINKNTIIINILKDVLRHDHSIEIRRMIIKGLEVTENTTSCLLERAVDIDMTIRRIFWEKILPKIKLTSLSVNKRIFILKRAFLEREFDATPFFYSFISDLNLEIFLKEFYCNEKEYATVIQNYLLNESRTFQLDKFDHIYVNFIYQYYLFIEQKMGRDSLELMDLKEFTEILYLRAVEINENQPEEVCAVKKLFKLLEFYDIFTDESKKYILSVVKKLLINTKITEIVEEAVILLKRICSEELLSFLKMLLGKLKGTKIGFILAEKIIKNVKLPADFEDAVINEIVLKYPEESLNVILQYFIRHKRIDQNLWEIYINYKTNLTVIEGITDLILLNIVDMNDVIYLFSDYDENTVIPLSKLILAGKISDQKFIKLLLFTFYTTETESIQQYLTCFFFEFFRKNSSVLISVYCEVLEEIESFHQIFIDQAIYWISNDIFGQNALQKLFYSVSIFVLKNYENLKNKSYLFRTFDKIEIGENWDKKLIKSLIYIFTGIIRKRPKENAQMVLHALIELDDGMPLDKTDIDQIENELK